MIRDIHRIVQSLLSVIVHRRRFSRAQCGADGVGPTRLTQAWAQLEFDVSKRGRSDEVELETILQVHAMLRLDRCLVSCDHIPRRSWPLFRARAVLNELVAGLSRQQSRPNIKPLEQSRA